MKKLIVILLSVVMAMGCLGFVSCGNSDSSDTIRLMTWHNEDESYYKAIREAADSYKELTGTEVKIIVQELTGYKSVLDTQFKSKSAPDIIDLQEDLRKTYADLGQLYDFTSVYSQKSAYSDAATWVDSLKGGINGFTKTKSDNKYGAITFVPCFQDPTLYTIQPLLVNVDILLAAGVTQEEIDAKPQTWKEMTDMMDKVIAYNEANGTEIIPWGQIIDFFGWTLGNIISQFGEGYYSEILTDATYDSIKDYEAELGDTLFDCMYRTGGLLQSQDVPYYEGMMEFFREFMQTYCQTGWESSTYDATNALFFNQQVAFLQVGNWLQADIVKECKDFNYTYFPVPLITEESMQGSQAQKTAAEYLSGKFPGADGQFTEGFSVPASLSENPEKLEKAIDFLQYLTSADIQKKVSTTAVAGSPTEGVDAPQDLLDYSLTEEQIEAAGGAQGLILGGYLFERADIWPDLNNYALGSSDAKTTTELIAYAKEKIQQSRDESLEDLAAEDGLTAIFADAKSALAAAQADETSGEAYIQSLQDNVNLIEARIKVVNAYGGLNIPLN